jgi:hypothetical protein
MKFNPNPFGLAALSASDKMAYMPTPLDRIRGRRMQDKEAERAMLETLAQAEYQRSQARKLRYDMMMDAQDRATMAGAPQIQHGQGYTQSIVDQANYLRSRGMGQQGNETLTRAAQAPHMPGTGAYGLKETATQAEAAADYSQASLNRTMDQIHQSLLFRERKGATQGDTEWAKGVIAGGELDPGTVANAGWIGLFKKNWSPEQSAQYAQILADAYNRRIIDATREAMAQGKTTADFTKAKMDAIEEFRMWYEKNHGIIDTQSQPAADEDGWSAREK